jgi:hypothetical protein
LWENAQKEINETLTPEQLNRLKQIEQQQNVAGTLADDEEMQKSLKLEPDLIAKIKAIKDESSKEIAQFQVTQIKLKQNLFDTQQKVAILQKDANVQTLRLLTDNQKAMWKQLTGEPFEVKLDGYAFGKKK